MVLLGLCLLLAVEGYAKPTDTDAALPDAPELSDYLAYAALHNPGFESSFYNWQAALDRIPQTGVLPEPRIAFAWYIENVETRTGPQEFSIGLSQTIPWPQKLSLMRAATVESAHAEKERYQVEKLRLFYRVKDIYYRYYYLGKSISIVKENLALLKNWEKILQIKYRTATGRHQDLIKVQVELGKLSDHLQSLIEMQDPLQADFNAILNRKIDLAIPWPKKITLSELQITPINISVLIMDANPEIQALHFEALKYTQRMKLADKRFYPDFTVGVNYIGTGDAVIPGQSDSGDDPIIASLSMTIPLWREKYRAEKREAKNRQLAAEKKSQDLTNRLLARSRRLFFEVSDAKRKVNLYRDTLIPKGEQSLEAVNTAYQAGGAQFLDLIDAQRVLLEFQLSYEKALADHERAIAALEMITGHELTRARVDVTSDTENKSKDNDSHENKN